MPVARTGGLLGAIRDARALSPEERAISDRVKEEATKAREVEAQEVAAARRAGVPLELYREAKGAIGQETAQTQDFFSRVGGADPFTAGREGGEAVRAQDPTYGMTPAERAQYDTNAARDARFGNDMAWLDPAFQQQAQLLGQSAGSQAYSDPLAAVAQYRAMGAAEGLANTPLQFQGSGAQQALSDQWAGIQAGQGAPQFMGQQQQQQLMQQLLGVRAPQFAGDADQRAVMNQALGMQNNTGPNSLQFDTTGRQGEQYGNLQGIIAGGGADAIERAQRASARADSESWLRGQREADMADYAERGLTGSGMELLALSGDRQAAAGRNSLADLQTSAALEERRLGAINSAADLATSARGQTTDEQALLNNRAMSGLTAAASTANAMRDANYNEQSFLNESGRQQAVQAAQIADQMRNSQYNENTYLDKRMLDALGQQSDLQSKMRDQQYNEQIGGRDATQRALDLQARLANDVRTSSAQEGQYRATSADAFARYNQDAINNANSTNSQFLQNAYTNTMANRTNQDIRTADRNAQAAAGLYGEDAADARAAGAQATTVGTTTSNQHNNAQQDFRGDLLGVGIAGNAGTLASQQNKNAIYPEMMGVVGDAYYQAIMAGMGAAGGGAGGLSTAGTTWASSVPGATNAGTESSQHYTDLFNSIPTASAVGSSTQALTSTRGNAVGPQLSALQTQQQPALSTVPQSGTDAYMDLQKKLLQSNKYGAK